MAISVDEIFWLLYHERGKFRSYNMIHQRVGSQDKCVAVRCSPTDTTNLAEVTPKEIVVHEALRIAEKKMRSF